MRASGSPFYDSLKMICFDQLEDVIYGFAFTARFDTVGGIPIIRTKSVIALVSGKNYDMFLLALVNKGMHNGRT